MATAVGRRRRGEEGATTAQGRRRKNSGGAEEGRTAAGAGRRRDFGEGGRSRDDVLKPKRRKKETIGISHDRLDNIWSWSLESSGVYSVASLRRYIDDKKLPKLPSGAWEWNSLVPRKVNNLAWRVCHTRLPMRENVFNIGIRSSSVCSLCNNDVESESHPLIACVVSNDVWAEVQNWWHLFPASFDSLSGFMHSKDLIPNFKRLAQIHEVVMLVFIWVIWKFRNEKVHSVNLKTHRGLANEIQVLSHL
ncbi:hypothetical protein LXL04_007246 [Taraxacum kok-saghyz]